MMAGLIAKYRPMDALILHPSSYVVRVAQVPSRVHTTTVCEAWNPGYGKWIPGDVISCRPTCEFRNRVAYLSRIHSASTAVREFNWRYAIGYVFRPLIMQPTETMPTVKAAEKGITYRLLVAKVRNMLEQAVRMLKLKQRHFVLNILHKNQLLSVTCKSQIMAFMCRA